MEETTLGLILGFAGLCITQAVVWNDGRRRSDKTDVKIGEVGANADTAATEAQLAAKRAEPVSNGFAGSVLRSLAEIKDQQKESRKELKAAIERLDRHLGDHATADVLRKGE